MRGRWSLRGRWRDYEARLRRRANATSPRASHAGKLDDLLVVRQEQPPAG